MTEMVVVGGGVYGCGLAWHLASLGYTVRLIEAKHIGAGASAGPGRRGVRANGRDHRELPLMRSAYGLWPNLHEALDCSAFYEQVGHLMLVERESDMPRAQAMIELQQSHGIATEWIDAQALRSMEPQLSQHMLGAVYCPLDGVADHSATTAAYHQAAIRAGVRVDEGTQVMGFEIRDAKVVQVLTQNGSVAVDDSVFVLANAGVASLISASCQRSTHTWNSTFQVLLTDPCRNVSIRHLLGHFSRVVSIKSDVESQVMISGGYPGEWDPGLAVGHAIQSNVDSNLADAVAVLPNLSGATVQVADANHLEAVSLDDLPTIDQFPNAENAYFATGWSGHGWAIAPSVVTLLSQWVTSGQRPPCLRPFQLDRFDSLLQEVMQ